MTELWTLPEDQVSELARRMGGLGLLSAEERARHGRLRTPGARRRFLGGRLLCRRALSAATGLPPDTWRFVRTRYGRPELEGDHEGLRFNVSHTEGLIACVVTRGRACGVDVERAPFAPGTARLLRDRFDAAQRAALDAAPDRPAALTELWVLTEAYLKGLGTGLAYGVRGLRFTPCGPGRFTVYDGRRPAPGSRWHAHLLRPGPAHLLAVAVPATAPAPAPHPNDPLHPTAHRLPPHPADSAPPPGPHLFPPLATKATGPIRPHPYDAPSHTGPGHRPPPR
ncbi:4'-phosphopantetheinyl transferase family protein [Streptomyces fungicidicus]|uniref:4'-phosphopantetheinyl transferase family protein n=1 Tax=Streptomyces fungicidicus TaxID=68203 RepID=UPI0036A1B0C2